MATSKMKMVMKGGKKVPAFAADGVGKMKKGGAAGMHKMPDGSMMKNSDMAGFVSVSVIAPCTYSQNISTI